MSYPSVWRVFNGYIEFSEVHRIAVAFEADEAIRLALDAGMEETDMMTAIEVMSVAELGCESGDYNWYSGGPMRRRW